MEQTALDAISIHTSTREVTKIMDFVRRVFPISIHTSTREVTCLPDQQPGPAGISIHTSTREVTALFPAGAQPQ